MWDEPYDLEDLDARQAGAERVLVVVVPTLRDWERVRSERWYRIPVARAMRPLAADYLAFYHTAACGDDLRWQVVFYAPVSRYRLARRRELLPDEPNHARADQVYYKVELGDLVALPQPLPARRLRRVTFIPTTLDRLLAATDVAELWEHSTARERLYEALRAREVPVEKGYWLREGGRSYHADLVVRAWAPRLAILCLHPTVCVAGDPSREVLERHGWAVLAFPAPEVVLDPTPYAEAVCRQFGASA